MLLSTNTTLKVRTYKTSTTLSNVVSVAAGYRYTLALHSTGTVWATGYNLEGQLGLGTWQSTNIPLPLVSLTTVANVTSFADTNCIPRRAYTYRLRAANSLGLSDPVDTSATTPLTYAQWCLDNALPTNTPVTAHAKRFIRLKVSQAP